MRVVVVIPALNEKRTIAKVILRFKKQRMVGEQRREIEELKAPAKIFAIRSLRFP